MSHWKQSNPDNEKSVNLLLFLFGILIQGNRQQSAFRLSVNNTNTRLLRLDNRDSPGLIAAIKKGCKPKPAAFVVSSFRQKTT